jgi:hypothetical protein
MNARFRPPLRQQSGLARRKVAALDQETRDWVLGLRNKAGGPCCETADGFPVEVDGWDMAGTVDDTSDGRPATPTAAIVFGYVMRSSNRLRIASCQPLRRSARVISGGPSTARCGLLCPSELT